MVSDSVGHGVYVLIPTRYALAAVPALAAFGLPTASTRVGRFALSILAGGLVVGIFGAIVFA